MPQLRLRLILVLNYVTCVLLLLLAPPVDCLSLSLWIFALLLSDEVVASID